MVTYAAVLAGLVTTAILVRAALKFDRKMVEAGKRRRLGSEAQSDGNA